MESFSHKCPSCGSNIEYDAETLLWKCQYCNQIYTQNQIETFEEKENSLSKSEIESSTEASMDLYTCENCGAQLVTDENTAATFCVYCGSSALIKDRLSGEFKPDYLIPFKKTQKQAQESFIHFMNHSLFIPDKFMAQENLEKMRGVYIPFWTYDQEQRLYKKGTGINITKWTSGDYSYTKEDTYEFERDVSVKFDDVPVDGSKKFEDDLMDSIEPFEYKEKEKFDARYLAGFLSEKYDVDKEEAYQRAELRMKNTTQKIINQSISFDKQTVTESKEKGMKGEINYWLLPVWMLNTQYKSKRYEFAMNGQTGKVVGKLPLSIPKIFGVAFVLFLPLFLLGYLLDSIHLWMNEDFERNFGIMSYSIITIIVLGFIGAGIMFLKKRDSNGKNKKVEVSARQRKNSWRYQINHHMQRYVMITVIILAIIFVVLSLSSSQAASDIFQEIEKGLDSRIMKTDEKEEILNTPEIDTKDNYVSKKALYFYQCLNPFIKQHHVRFIIVFALIVDFFVMIILLRKNKTVRNATHGDEYIEDIHFFIKQDTLIDSHTDVVYTPPQDNNGSGTGGLNTPLGRRGIWGEGRRRF